MPSKFVAEDRIDWKGLIDVSVEFLLNFCGRVTIECFEGINNIVFCGFVGASSESERYLKLHWVGEGCCQGLSY